MTRVLIVDDNAENIYLLRALLQGSGCVVDDARHGAEALVKAHQIPPDLIVSDLLMPVMDGYTLLRRWKSDEQLREIPFVVYTATYTEPKDERLALELGADAYIVKPAEPEPFMARIRAVVEKAAQGNLPPARVPQTDEKLVLREYSEILVRKLEEKSIQLEQANRVLQEDVGRLLHAENALRENQRLLAESQRIAQIGSWSVDLKTRRLVWTDETYRLYGVARETFALNLDSFFGLIHPDDRSAMLAWVEMCQDGGSPGELEFRVPFPNGDTRVLRGRGSLRHDVANQPVEMIGTVQDVTERKIVDAEKQRLETQLQQAQKMEAVGQLTAGIAHDFNNILASILGYTELALEVCAPDQAGELTAYLREVHTAGIRARDLVANLLAFSRPGASQQRPVVLGQMAQEVFRMLVPTLPSSIVFATQIETPVATVLADPAQLHQVIVNLVINARDAVDERGRITLIVREARGVHAVCAGCHRDVAGDFLELAVSDNGPGIPPENLSRIFDPFYTTKAVGQGTGLGLSVVHGVVHRCGGHVVVASNPGGGTVMRVLLPMSNMSVASINIDGPTNAVREPVGHQHILVVDDEDVLARLIGEVLKAHGYRVTVFSDSQSALDQFRATPDEFAAVISDQTMPKLTGVELVHLLRAIQPQLPIILCTGFSVALDEKVANSLNVALLHKPHDFETLLHTLEQQLAAARIDRR